MILLGFADSEYVREDDPLVIVSSPFYFGRPALTELTKRVFGLLPESDEEEIMYGHFRFHSSVIVV